MEQGRVWYSDQRSSFSFIILWFIRKYYNSQLFLFLCRRRDKGCHFIKIIDPQFSPFPCSCGGGWERLPVVQALLSFMKIDLLDQSKRYLWALFISEIFAFIFSLCDCYWFGFFFCILQSSGHFLSFLVLENGYLLKFKI